MPIRGRERKHLEDSLDRRREAREDVVGGFAEIEGKTYCLKNWSPNGFCIGPTALTPNPSDRLDIKFTIPLPDLTLTFQCRTGVMRHDPESEEIGGVFFNLPEDVQTIIDKHFDIRAPKGYGIALFEKLRDVIVVSLERGSAQVGAEADALHKNMSVTSSGLSTAGKGVPRSSAEAVKAYRDAAEKGCADGQALLGLSYFMGEGVPQDYVHAQMWLNLAAMRGHEEAVTGRDMVAERMSPEQNAEAQRLTREWMDLHGELLPPRSGC